MAKKGIGTITAAGLGVASGLFGLGSVGLGALSIHLSKGKKAGTYVIAGVISALLLRSLIKKMKAKNQYSEFAPGNRIKDKFNEGQTL